MPRRSDRRRCPRGSQGDDARRSRPSLPSIEVPRGWCRQAARQGGTVSRTEKPKPQTARARGGATRMPSTTRSAAPARRPILVKAEAGTYTDQLSLTHALDIPPQVRVRAATIGVDLADSALAPGELAARGIAYC